MKYLILFTLFLTACGGSDGSTPANKELFSSWTSTVTGGTLDLTGLSNGAHPIRLWYSPNSGCDCTIDIFGDQATGTANLLSCSQFGPGSYCAGIEDLYGYSNTGGVLTLCGSDGCETYR
jgi:hypothetical protein